MALEEPSEQPQQKSNDPQLIYAKFQQDPIQSPSIEDNPQHHHI